MKPATGMDAGGSAIPRQSWRRGFRVFKESRTVYLAIVGDAGIVTVGWNGHPEFSSIQNGPLNVDYISVAKRHTSGFYLHLFPYYRFWHWGKEHEYDGVYSYGGGPLFLFVWG